MRSHRAPSGRLRPRRRRGYGLIELAIAILILMVVLGVMVKALTGIGIERRAADHRLMAIQEVSNLMERLSSEPFDKLSTEHASAIAAGVTPKKGLPGASYQVDVVEAKGSSLPAKRLSVRLRWNDRSGGWDAPVALTSWVYPQRTP